MMAVAPNLPAPVARCSPVSRSWPSRVHRPRRNTAGDRASCDPAGAAQADLGSSQRFRLRCPARSPVRVPLPRASAAPSAGSCVRRTGRASSLPSEQPLLATVGPRRTAAPMGRVDCSHASCAVGWMVPPRLTGRASSRGARSLFFGGLHRASSGERRGRPTAGDRPRGGLHPRRLCLGRGQAREATTPAARGGSQIVGRPAAAGRSLAPGRCCGGQRR